MYVIVYERRVHSTHRGFKSLAILMVMSMRIASVIVVMQTCISIIIQRGAEAQPDLALVEQRPMSPIIHVEVDTGNDTHTRDADEQQLHIGQVGVTRVIVYLGDDDGDDSDAEVQN